VSDDPPRLRMFAGPNGSGKTTVKNGLDRPASWFGVYINPDEIERQVRDAGTLSLAQFELTTNTNEVGNWFANSILLQRAQLAGQAGVIEVRSGLIDFRDLEMNSYYASVLADFLRHKLLRASKSFSTETVMSFHDKVDLLRDAQTAGFRTYLYYVATEDPAINIERVKYRVGQGGHNVPEDKIGHFSLIPRGVSVSMRSELRRCTIGFRLT
jgi:predicted ABC-type ATPase